MTDIPAARSNHAPCFSHRIGRKIIVEHKWPVFFSNQRFNPLLILTRTKGQHTEHLGFSPCKEGAAVCPGQYAGLAGNGSYFIKFSVIDTAPFTQDKISADFLQYIFKYIGYFALAISIVFPEFFMYIRFDGAKCCRAVSFSWRKHGFGYQRICFGFNFSDQFFIPFGRYKGPFRHSIGLLEFYLQIYDRLHGLMAEKDGFKHIGFTDNVAAAFYHDDTGF